MSRKKFFQNFSYILLIFIFLLVISPLCRADDAMVLPKNRWMTNLSFDIYPAWDKEYNDQGKGEALAIDYNTELDETVLDGLAPFTAYGPSLGRSIVEFEKSSAITNFSLAYGLKDNLSLGLKIPFWTFKTKVTSSLDSSSATMAKNPNYDPTDPINNPPIVPEAALLAAGLDQATVDSLKLSREEVLNLLSDGVDVNNDGDIDIQGYGYDRFETWEESGIGDIELGLKYKYLENAKWRCAVQGGLRMPTGRENDPDNLVDYGFGGGNYDLILSSYNDYTGFKNLVLNSSLYYINQLPDKRTERIPDDVDMPLTNNKERVDRDEGDILQIELSAKYSFSPAVSLSATYGGFFKAEDNVEGSSGHIDSLEDKTAQTGHTYLIGVSYNNLKSFQEKKVRVPFYISLSQWNRFDGKNLNKALYYSINGGIFF
ncbi:MAG: hypothetical protein ACMUJM_02335 [bacterium]